MSCATLSLCLIRAYDMNVRAYMVHHFAYQRLQYVRNVYGCQAGDARFGIQKSLAQRPDHSAAPHAHEG